MADEVRMIDANRLKQEIETRCKDERMNISATAYFAIIAGFIDKLPTIEAEPVNGWISVDDRLPEPYTMVLVHDTDGKIFTVIYKNDYLKFITGYTITHWQPLPEPPKGE